MTLTTPDGRYIVVRGRLWRAANPNLEAEAKTSLVRQLMSARRAVREALKGNDLEALAAARAQVQAAKQGLGERGPVWWTDDAPDENRRLVRNTAYADWYADGQGEGSATADPSSERVRRPRRGRR